MGLLNPLLDLFRPRWKRSSPEVRAGYASSAAVVDLKILKAMGVDDADPMVREVAKRRHQELLAEAGRGLQAVLA